MATVAVPGLQELVALDFCVLHLLFTMGRCKREEYLDDQSGDDDRPICCHCGCEIRRYRDERRCGWCRDVYHKRACFEAHFCPARAARYGMTAVAFLEAMRQKRGPQQDPSSSSGQSTAESCAAT